jgi:hypothetical protein
MKLKTEVIYIIDGYDRHNNNKIKRALCQTLNCEINSIYRYLHENRANGELTKLAALKLIADKLSMNLDDLTE